MEIQPIGERNLLIYLNGDEVRALPAPPAELKTNDAAYILEKALGEDDRELWQNAYLELIAGSDSLILIARAHSGDPYYFCFSEIERIIEAAKLCPQDILSYLTYIEGIYYLTVYPWDTELPPDILFEYGDEAMRHPSYMYHLTEHGRLLLGPSALDDLKKYF